MSQAGPEDEIDEDARRRASWALTGLGVAAIVGAALWLSSAGYGTRVRRAFADRRSYDMVKPAVHRALPGVAALGLGGLGLLLAGARMRRPRSE